MITKVRLKNWKSHLDSEFNFEKGVNALVGINGAGKSSVLDAISFALFGTFPSHTNRKVGLDDAIMSKPIKRDEAEIIVEFFSGGKRYSVLRKIKNGKGTVQAEIREDGRLVEVNPEGVTRHIERVLQIDYPLFSKAVYSEQNNIDYFLTVPKGRRMQHIDRMLKLDRFEEIRGAAGSLKNSIENRVGEKARILGELKKEDVEGRILKGVAEVEGLEEKRRQLIGKFESVKEGRGRLEKTVLVFENKKSRFNEIDKRLESLRSAQKEVLNSLKEKAADSMNKAQIIEEVEGIKKSVGTMEAELGRKRGLMEAGRSLVAVYNVEIKSITDAIAEMGRVAGAKCPVCDSDLGDERRKELNGKRALKIVGVRKSLEKAVADLIRLKGEAESIEGALREKQKAADSLANRLGEFEILERLVNKSKILELDIERFDAEIRVLGGEIKSLDIENAKASLMESVRECGELQSEILSSETLIKREKAALAELEKRAGLITKYQEDVVVSEKMAGLLGCFVKALMDTQNQLREEFTKTVNYIMGSIWSSLYPYGDFTGIRLAVEESDYNLEIKNMETWVGVDGFASGGERSLACLALRVAFSLAFIPNLRWLILDEPTHNLDAASIQRFSALMENIGGFVNQIFLITHENRVVEDIEGPVYRLERDKAANGVTKVVKI